jgi:multimeric flavodoxin WrbA
LPQTPEPRKGMPSVKLDEAEFRKRFLIPYLDPAFDPLRAELDKIAGAAWDGYANSRKSPVTRKAGPGHADPDYDLATDWIAARKAVDEAQALHEDAAGPGHVLLVNGSSRSEHTCPGEMSKSYRLLEIAKAVLDAGGLATTVLNLSDLASEYGRRIHPCKACFSTAAALCHWPCSCYPNYSLGQAQDWMNDIYPMWVRAHGVLIISPVNWYQATSPLKLMIDRLVCADGGNPDPTSTHGKEVEEAKALELAGWDYPRHLEGRLFAVISHGDTEGATGLRRNLSDWMAAMQMVPAGPAAELDRYIGYYEPYTTSHQALDMDHAIQEEVRNVARALLQAVKAKREGRLVVPGAGLKEPRPK